MKEFLFRERVKMVRLILDADYDPPTKAQWEVIDKLVNDLEEPLSRDIAGFKKYYRLLRRTYTPDSRCDWALFRDAFDNMRNFHRWDPPEPTTTRLKRLWNKLKIKRKKK